MNGCELRIFCNICKSLIYLYLIITPITGEVSTSISSYIHSLI